MGGELVDYDPVVKIDSNEDITIVGRTGSQNFPIKNAIQQNLNMSLNKNLDLYVLRLNEHGELQWSTFWGGPELDNSERSPGIVITPDKKIIISGHTYGNLPNTTGTFQSSEIFISIFLEKNTLFSDSTTQSFETKSFETTSPTASNFSENISSIISTTNINITKFFVPLVIILIGISLRRKRRT